MSLLRSEVVQLDGRDPIIAACFVPGDIRRDGLPRSGARPTHPGIELSFEALALTPPRRLVYITDAHEDWEHNVRGIALGLQALRAVDRYGITRSGEQYAGFAAITAGGPDPVRGERLVHAAGGIREALFKHHPDHGGNDRDFADVQAYRRSKEGVA
jgi:hypothetical protein